MKADGILFDGRSSVKQRGIYELVGDELVFRINGGERRIPLAAVVVAPRVGGVQRSFSLPDGGRGETASSGLIEELLRRQGCDGGERLHRWERHLGRVALALLLTIVVIWGAIRFGIPPLARLVAFAVPPAAEERLGHESLTLLDKLVFTTTTLPQKRQEQVTAILGRLESSAPSGFRPRLEFRASRPLGANAFALPSGILVVTDDLVALAKHDDELLAVFAHELGHLQGRHALRHALQSSAAGLLLAAVTGDILSVTSFAATLPTSLVEAKYSRDFEYEADDAAIAALRRLKIPPQRFADFLTRLQAAHDKRTGQSLPAGARAASDYLSTHPATADRLARITAPPAPSR